MSDTTNLTRAAYTYWQELTKAIRTGDRAAARHLTFNIPPDAVPIIIGHGAQLVSVAWPNGLPDLTDSPHAPETARETAGDQ